MKKCDISDKWSTNYQICNISSRKKKAMCYKNVDMEAYMTTFYVSKAKTPPKYSFLYQ